MRLNKTGWGNLKQVVVQLAIYFTPISWGMMFLTAWNTTISRYISEWGYDVPTWAVAVVGACVVVTAGFVEWRYSLPSYFASYNKQMYTEDSPVMKELSEIKRLINERH